MTATNSQIFRFADVEVREREFTLVKAGQVLTVEPKAFRALMFLLHNPQRLISKEELLNSVWGDAAVTEGSLTRCIWLLRSVLGDDIRDPRYIETVATVGYRWVCKLEVSEEAVGSVEDAGESTSTATASALAVARSTKPWKIASAFLLVAVLVAGGLYYQSHRSRPLTATDTIVLADFDNRTGDAVFDGTLLQGLSVQLEQSPFLRIVPDQQVRQTLQMMDQKADS